MRINLYLLLFSCGGSEYQLDAGYSSCPDVYVTCPEPIVNVTSDSLNISCPDVSCPDPIVEVVIEQDCPSLECPDVSCPAPVTEVVVNNDIDTQPIADEIAVGSLSSCVDQREYYAESVQIPVGGTTIFTNNQSTDFIITHLWTKNGIYGGAECWREIGGIPSYPNSFTSSGSWRSDIGSNSSNGAVVYGVGTMSNLTIPISPSESLVCIRSNSESSVYFQGYWQ